MWRKVLHLGLLVISLSACIAQTKLKTVTIVYAVPDWELAWGNLSEQIVTFEKTHPGIHVEPKPFSEILGLAPGTFSLTDELWLKLASNADVFRVVFDNGISQQMVHSGLVKDLTLLMSADKSFDPDDFFPGVLDAAAWDNSVWAIPLALDYELIFFDQARFDVVGYPYPEPDWTWIDFAEFAHGLTARQGARIAQWGFVPGAYHPARMVESRNNDFFDTSFTPPFPRLSQPDIVAATQWWVNLIEDESVPYIEPSLGTQTEELIAQGQAAMWSGRASSWARPSQQSSIGVLPYPSDDKNARTTPMFVEQVAMSPGTMQAEAAWQWIVFLSRQPPQHPGRMPARQSVAAEIGFFENMERELATALRWATEHAFRSTLGDWDFNYDTLDRELRAAFVGDKTAQDALETAQDSALQALEAQYTQIVKPTPAPIIMTPSFVQIDPEATKVTFIPAVEDADFEAFRNSAQRFNATHPGIAVNIARSDSASAAVESLVQYADCFLSPLRQNVLSAALDIQPFAEADSTFENDDFFPHLLDLYRQKGQLRGIPAEVRFHVIAFPVDLLDTAGIAHPTFEWTVDDFLSLAQTLTDEDRQNKLYGFVSASELLDLITFVERLGGQILDFEEAPPMATFTFPATVEAVRWYADLSLRQGIKPLCEDDRACQNIIQTGRAGMWSGIQRWGRYDAVKTLPLPTGPGGNGAPMFYTSGYFISPQTTVAAACWDWIEFLTLETHLFYGLPSRRSVAISDAYRQRVGMDVVDVYVRSVENIQNQSVLYILVQRPELAPYLQFLEQAYRSIVEGQETPESAMMIAQRQADSYWACLAAAETGTLGEGQNCVERMEP